MASMLILKIFKGQQFFKPNRLVIFAKSNGSLIFAKFNGSLIFAKFDGSLIFAEYCTFFYNHQI